MTAVQKKRMRRRRRFRRNAKRLVLNILLAPMRMPRISGAAFETAMRLSEGTGMAFVALLMMHLFNPELIGLFPVIAAATIFTGCLLTIKIGNYQDRIEELKYYGYKVS